MVDKKKLVYIIYYSMYGHVQTMAREVTKGVELARVEAKLFQVAETLSPEILKRMHAPPKAADVPIISPFTTDFKKADGFIFGLPTRFGMVPGQMKTLFDQCGQLWTTGGLNKYVGTFFSTGGIGAGQETTAYSTMPFFAHMGMIYVTIGGKHKKLGDINLGVQGGSAWGAGTITGNDSSRQPSDVELEIAQFQGLDFGKIVKGANH